MNRHRVKFVILLGTVMQCIAHLVRALKRKIPSDAGSDRAEGEEDSLAGELENLRQSICGGVAGYIVM